MKHTYFFWDGPRIKKRDERGLQEAFSRIHRTLQLEGNASDWVICHIDHIDEFSTVEELHHKGAYIAVPIVK